ncbi:hypothetical protein OIU78_005829 [Salix suchowensis]|nr:hypothetical protein OIU78_005829 [Salix suchowensis]
MQIPGTGKNLQLLGKSLMDSLFLANQLKWQASGFASLHNITNQSAFSQLKRIHGFGVRKIAVTTLQPLGCLPISTAFSSYENCSESWNAASRFHNQKLQQEIQRMNKESRENIYETLDLYTAFMSKLSPAGNMKPSSFLMPCCVGMASDYSCGNIDKNGAKKYVVCEKPDLSIFWDMVHPAQNGWDQVYSSLKSSLHRLY